MKTPSLEEAVDIGVELQRIGATIARGEIPEPAEVVAVLASALLAFADDVEELGPHLSEAARIREDYFIELAARAQLGPRPPK